MNQNNANDLQLDINPLSLKPLYKKKTSRHLLAMIFDWTIIAATIYYCIQFFNPALYFLAVVIIGARMHALAILMHDATHFQFLRNRKWNDKLTNWLTMYPLFTSIEQYRQNHLRHHRHLNTEDDPDWVSKMGVKEFQFPKTKSDFIKTLLSYLVLYRGLRDAIWFLKRFAPTEKTAKKTNSKYERILFYILLATGLTLSGYWTSFLLFWVVPYFSTFFMFQYIRSVAEHFGELAYDHLLNSTRSVKTNLLERFFIAPHNVGFHLEHHLYPGVPFYNLPKLHQVLMNDSIYKEKAHITEGYMAGLLNELGKSGEVVVQPQ